MTINVGILGLGAIGETHARVISSLAPRLELVAYSCGQRRAADLAGRIPGHRESPQQLLADPAVDLVAITTPSNQHAKYTLAALACGKGVVVEKPLATTAAEAEEVVKAQRAAHVFGTTIAQRRFEPQHIAIKKLLDTGQLGRPIFGQTSLMWWRDPGYYHDARWRTQPPGGGVLMNQGLHNIDLLTWFMGQATEVAALNGNLIHPMPVEDTSVAAIRFASGAMGAVLASTATRPGSPAQLAIYTDRGRLSLDHATITQWDFPDVARPSTTAATGSGAADPGTIGDAGHRAQWLDIADAIEAGREPSIPLSEALPVIRLIDAVYKSDPTTHHQPVAVR